MNKAELFEKYHIDESHSQWEPLADNWISVEIYRIMNDGNLPKSDDMGVSFVCDFLDKRRDLDWWAKNVMTRSDWGSLYLTAKRMMHRHSDAILTELDWSA